MGRWRWPAIGCGFRRAINSRGIDSGIDFDDDTTTGAPRDLDVVVDAVS